MTTTAVTPRASTDAAREFSRGGLERIVEVERRFADELGVEDYETARRVLEGIGRILEDVGQDPA